MSGGIYLLQENGKLVEMNEQPYKSEDLLQELLANYPSLLAGNQIDSARPRRWLLVAREAAVPSEEDGADRWSVDHLFLDQDGIPTLVEVKRSSDTRIRREVVGQMLDYAANAVVYWPVEEIRSRFIVRCEEDGKNPADELKVLLAGETEPEQFWMQVKANLHSGKIRMLFVADEIPSELRRIVEFLNQQMEFAEVLAVEVKQFSGQGLKTLVPRVMGQTAESERAKSAGGVRARRQWDENSFFIELVNEQGPDAGAAARHLLDWTLKNSEVYWGRGNLSGSFTPIINHSDTWTAIFTVWTYGKVEVNFQYLKSKAPFQSEAKRLELLSRLNDVPGVQLPKDSISLRPRIHLADLKDPAVAAKFLTIFDWVAESLKKTGQTIA